MHVAGKSYRSINRLPGGGVEIIDQRRLPHALVLQPLDTAADAVTAIREMWVRGAPLIGATAAYGICLALREDPSDASLAAATEALLATRPTAVNLRWSLTRMRAAVTHVADSDREARAWEEADAIVEEDVRLCEAIGSHGLDLIRRHAEAAPGPVRVLTHCNAGWLATVDWGTATAPIYMAHDEGIEVHVWVSETRPRGQGAKLTAWELGAHGVPHTVVVDGAGAHLMQTRSVDLVLTGTDRTTSTGAVFNKIGTYAKAVAARDCDVPFYVAVPGPSIDWSLADDPTPVEIEHRAGDEVAWVEGATGADEGAAPVRVRVVPVQTAVANPAFDFTPARLVTGLITDRGLCAPGDLRALYGGGA